MKNNTCSIKAVYKRALLFIPVALLTGSCTKHTAEPSGYPSVNNTTWSAAIVIPGTIGQENIFEFFGNGSGFAWHPVGYSGSWTQNGAQVTFTFKETDPLGSEYLWDDTATLSSDGTQLTGTMLRRVDHAAGTFTATKL